MEFNTPDDEGVSYKNPGKNTFSFRLHDPKKFNKERVMFNSDFDSGNCKSVE